MKKALLIPVVSHFSEKMKKYIGYYFNEHISGSSAELSYYFLLSLFPLIMAASAFALLSGQNSESLEKLLSAVFPELIYVFLDNFAKYVRETDNRKFLSFGIILAVYALTRYIHSLKRKIREIYKSSSCKSFVPEWLTSFAFAVITVVGFYFTLLLQSFGSGVLGFLSKRVFFISEKSIDAFLVLRFAAIFIYIGILLVFAYKVIPNIPLSFSEILPGVIFSDIAWLAVSLTFSFYVDNISSYTLLYGSLGAFIALLLWLYLLNNIILIGAAVNRHFYLRGKKASFYY